MVTRTVRVNKAFLPKKINPINMMRYPVSHVLSYRERMLYVFRGMLGDAQNLGVSDWLFGLTGEVLDRALFLLVGGIKSSQYSLAKGCLYLIAAPLVIATALHFVARVAVSAALTLLCALPVLLTHAAVRNKGVDARNKEEKKYSFGVLDVITNKMSDYDRPHVSKEVEVPRKVVAPVDPEIQMMKNLILNRRRLDEVQAAMSSYGYSAKQVEKIYRQESPSQCGFFSPKFKRDLGMVRNALTFRVK